MQEASSAYIIFSMGLPVSLREYLNLKYFTEQNVPRENQIVFG